MRDVRWEVGQPPDAFVAFCAAAMPEVYGFLLARCGDPTTAEDLTSETFMAAVSAVRRATVTELSVGWLVVVARRRLVDHWRREERAARVSQLLDLEDVADVESPVEAGDSAIDASVGLLALQRLGPHHRAALTLRYVDGLPVAEVARELARGLHATEALLQRARRAFRRAYEEVRTHA
jgi:RNA polymerase sigma-70 factor (ECF subfamily)